MYEIFDTNNCEDGWFGQKYILLFGNLLQLSPVHKDPVFVQLSNDKINKYIGSLNAVNLWTTLFDYDKLTINMRQQRMRQNTTFGQTLLSIIHIDSVTK